MKGKICPVGSLGLPYDAGSAKLGRLCRHWFHKKQTMAILLFSQGWLSTGSVNPRLSKPTIRVLM